MHLKLAAAAVLACILPCAFAADQKPAPQPDLSGESAVVEQMKTVIRVAADGSVKRSFTMQAHLLSDAGVRDGGTVSVAFESLRETPTINYVRVRKPDGTVVETLASDAQELALPVTQAAPMYSDLKIKQLPVKSLGVGDTLEYQVTVDEKPQAPGAFWRGLAFDDSLPVKQETIELRVPRAMKLTVKSKKVEPVVTEEGTERVYRWKHETISEYPKKKEKDTAPVALVAPMYEPDIAVTSYQNWAELGAWYRGLMKDRAVPDAAIQAKADELTRGLATEDEKIEALYHYVATQYRYISVSLGIGAVQPHAASEVFRNQYGDCKDKHTLLQAMLAAEKIEAVPVLIHSANELNQALPMPSQFDHMITLVRPGPRELWLDTTPEVSPLRWLAPTLRGKQALAVPPAGDAHLVTTPASLPFSSYYRQTLTGSIDASGTLTAHFDMVTRGDVEVVFRSVFHQVPRAKWQELEQSISERSGYAGQVSATDANVPEKTQEPFHVSWDYTRKEFGDWPNRSIPTFSLGFGADIPNDTKPPERAMQLEDGVVTELSTTLTLPEGYSLVPPENFERSTPFAEYSSTYKLEGRTLQMHRRLLYKVHELPASEWAALRDFEVVVNTDATRTLQLLPPAGTAWGTPSGNQEVLGLLEQAELKIRANDLKDAEDLLAQAAKKDEHATGLLAARGNLEWRKNNLSGAIADYRKEIEAHPQYLWSYPALAAAYRQNGDLPQAEDVLRAWVKASPADARAKAQLAGALQAQEKYKEAIPAYEEAIKLSDKPDELRISLGIAQLKAGQTDAGKATLHAVMDHSDDAGMLNSAAYELAEADLDLDADEAAARKAVALLETRSNATQVATASKEDLANVLSLGATWDTLGWIDYKEHKLAEAESYVSSAWLLVPNSELALHLGRIYEAEGKKADALTRYRLGAKMVAEPHPSPARAHMKQELEGRIEALKAEGIREKPLAKTQPGGDELGAMRTYTVASPLKGEYASADFLLLLGDNHADEVRFLKGAESLRAAEPILAKAEYRSPLPQGSHAHILRRGILACTTGSKDCLLVLLAPGEARVD